MKSILADFRRSKIAVLTILKALNFDFCEKSHLKMSKISNNLKFWAAEVVKMADFETLKPPKIDFT